MTDASTEISLCDASLMLRPDLPLGVWAIYFFIGTSLIQLGESILELPCSSSSLVRPPGAEKCHSGHGITYIMRRARTRAEKRNCPFPLGLWLGTLYFYVYDAPLSAVPDLTGDLVRSTGPKYDFYQPRNRGL